MPKKRIRWIDKSGRYPRQFGAIELAHDYLADSWVKRGIAEYAPEEDEKPKPKPAPAAKVESKEVAGPPETTAMSSDATVTKAPEMATASFGKKKGVK